MRSPAPTDPRGAAKDIPRAVKDVPSVAEDVPSAAEDVPPAHSLLVLSVSVTLFLVGCILHAL